MHFYNHNIKTWVAATAHLSDDEDLAYRRLTELYYDKEGALENNPEVLAKRIRMHGKVEAVAAVLAETEFYTLGEDGRYHNSKCDEEIESYRKMSSGGRRGAQSRWKKNNENSDVDGPPIAPIYPPHSNPNANQEPRTKNQEPLLNIEGKEPDGFDEFWEMYPRQRRGSKDKAVVAYKNALKRARKEEINAGCRGYITSDEVARGFAKGAAAWLNDDRWTTQYRAAGLGSDAAPRGSGKIGQSYGRPEPRDITGAALRVAARYSQEK